MCKVLIFNYRKSISGIIPNFVPILFYRGYKLILKEWTRYVAKYSLREISETLNGHISKVLLCDLSTSYITIFIGLNKKGANVRWIFGIRSTKITVSSYFAVMFIDTTLSKELQLSLKIYPNLNSCNVYHSTSSNW